MFVKERYIVILLCLVEFEIHQCTGPTTRDLRRRTRKPGDQRSVDFKNSTFLLPNKLKKIIIANNKMGAHQHIFKEREKMEKNTRKWPKFMRQGRGKRPLRFTKMDMLQENNQTTEKIAMDNEEDEGFSSYGIKEQLQKLAKGLPDINITLEVIGRTLEYQDIVMLRISEIPKPETFFRADEHKYAEEVPEKKIILIVHGLSVMGVRDLPCLSSLYSFRILLTYYTSHLDKFDIFLIPIANPDGYSYTLTERYTYNKMWNKNVSPQAECPGVALDRNFDVSWGNNRSLSSCSQEYPGPEAFSEAETKAIRDIFHKYAHKIIAYFNVHPASYGPKIFRGDAVLYPKGYSDNPVDDDKYIDLRAEIDEAIRNASFQVYSVAVDTLYNWYGRITGTSVDYASTIYGIPYAMELVMQHYEEEETYASNTEFYTHLALTEVWRRVIDVIFGSIWKSVHGNDVR